MDDRVSNKITKKKRVSLLRFLFFFFFLKMRFTRVRIESLWHISVWAIWRDARMEPELSLFHSGLKQQNRYLSVIIVCGYFSFIRSFTWLNYPSESNSYHKTSLSVSFGCWHLSGIPLCPLHFTVCTIAWQRKFEPHEYLTSIYAF